jgi:hypothetical protein
MRTAHAPLALAFVVALAAAACGASSPESECRDYARAVCSHVASCIPGTTADACVDGLYRSGLRCSNAVAVSPDLETCRNAWTSASCDRLREANASGGVPAWLPDACRAPLFKYR